MALEIGSVLEGTVTGITSFGAFVSLPENKSGMVHISEVAQTYVKDINEHIQIGDTVQVKVLNMDPAGKISLSIRRAQPEQPRAPRPTEVQMHSRPAVQDSNFEDRISRFMKESEDRLLDIRRNKEHRRGSGRNR